jgi:hypothetical protein
MDISRFENESNIVYNFRQTFVENYKKDNKDEDINNIIKYSKILANIKFKGCTYDDSIYDKLKTYLK